MRSRSIFFSYDSIKLSPSFFVVFVSSDDAELVYMLSQPYTHSIQFQNKLIEQHTEHTHQQTKEKKKLVECMAFTKSNCHTSIDFIEERRKY